MTANRISITYRYNERGIRRLFREIYEFLETKDLNFPEVEEGEDEYIERQIVVDIKSGIEGFTLIRVIFGENFLPKSLRVHLYDHNNVETRVNINLVEKKIDFGENTDRKMRFVRLPLLELIWEKVLPKIVK